MKKDYKIHFRHPRDAKLAWCGLKIKINKAYETVELPIAHTRPDIVSCANCLTLYYKQDRKEWRNDPKPEKLDGTGLEAGYPVTKSNPSGENDD